jgi:hypothetical protein
MSQGSKHMRYFHINRMPETALISFVEQLDQTDKLCDQALSV